MPRTTYSAARATFIAAVAPILIGLAPLAAPAQPLGTIPVTVRYINDFAAGYSATRHAYDSAWIREVLVGATTREVEAFGDAVRGIQIPQRNNVDGSRVVCKAITVRGAPPGVVALRWTVIGRHPLTRRIVNLKSETRTLHPFRFVRSPGSPCSPTGSNTTPLVITEKEYNFRTALSTASVTSAPASYTIQVEALDAAGRALLAGAKPVSIPRHVPLIVSVGESLAAGQGNPDVIGDAAGNRCKTQTSIMFATDAKPTMHREAKWLEAEDYRSLHSSHALAAQMMLNEWPYVVFLSFAKSGSLIRSDSQPHDIIDQLADVERIVGTHPIDALLVSAGGNDVGFAIVLEGLTKGGASQLQRGRLEAAFDTLRTERYPSLNAAIARLKVGRVIINEYPGGLFNDARNRPRRGCGIFELGDRLPLLVITEREARGINLIGQSLNAEISRAAQRFNWQLVDGIDEKFAGHGYCSGQSWFVFAEDSCEQQGDFEGTMHPNVAGTREIATAIAKELRRVLPRPTGQPAQGR